MPVLRGDEEYLPGLQNTVPVGSVHKLWEALYVGILHLHLIMEEEGGCRDHGQREIYRHYIYI